MQQNIDALAKSIDAKDSIEDRHLADVNLSNDLKELIQTEKVDRECEDRSILTALNKEIEDRTKAVSDEADKRYIKDTELESAIATEQRERKAADVAVKLPEIC